MSRKKSAKDVMLPHSQAKVAFYREYLTRFLSIMSVSTYCQTVNIFDVFCGRGIYSDGGHGSPIQAMEAVQQVRTDHPSNTNFRLYFNDLVKKNVAGVKEYIDQNFTDGLCAVTYLNAPAAKLFESLCPYLNSTPRNSQNLLFIDPYGYKDIHKSTLHNLLRNGRTEILLFLPISFMHRFTHYAFDGDANKGALPLKEFISEFFPEDHPVRSDRPMEVKQYIRELAKAFSFNGAYLTTSYFIKRDSKNYFAVFFITTNWLGLERAIDSIWTLDEAQGQGFRLEKHNENEPRLFDEQFFIEDQRRMVHEKIKVKLLGMLTKRAYTNPELYQRVLLDGYAIPRVTPVLKELQDNGIIEVEQYGQNKPARKHSFYLNYQQGKDLSFPKVLIKLANKVIN